MDQTQNPLPPLEERFSFLAHRINAQLTRICNPMFRKWNVDIDMSRMLVMLKQQGEMTAGEIVDFMALPQSTVSYQIKRLEKLGYIKRASSREDSRVVVARLTASGKKVAEESNELSREITAVMVDAISEMDGDALRAGLQKMDSVLTEFRDVEGVKNHA
jgi:MarR family transcriptional regulator, organic hydroperoxide resistance regulator